MTKQSVTVLGATGSIGVSTLDVIARHPDRFDCYALTAKSNIQLLAQQCQQFQPRYVVVQQASAAEPLAQLLKQTDCTTQVLSGSEALQQVAAHHEVDTVLAGIVGAAGLMPTLAAVNAGKKVLLANKEALVMAGPLMMQAKQQSGATLLPIDSEHNAIFQCLPDHYRAGDAIPAVRRIMLTASGGPFRDTPVNELTTVTPEQAIAHPNWSMGKKISIDSATMMNKGLEVIEAHWLFNLSFEQIDVVLHPQSIIHSLVEYLDGSTLAQLGNHDMRVPIAHALAWPERIESGVPGLDILQRSLDFQPLSETRYPCLALAKQALRSSGTATTILNAANEVAVAAFLNGNIRFTDIARLVEAALSHIPPQVITELDCIISADQKARDYVHLHITKSVNYFQ